MRKIFSYSFIVMSILCQAVFADRADAVISEMEGFDAVWVLTTPGSRVVTLRIEFSGGAALDPPDRKGLTGLAMLSLNGAIRSQPGAQIRIAVEPNYSVLTIQVLQSDLTQTLAKFEEMLTDGPLFSEALFKRTQRQVESFLKSISEDTYSFSKQQWWQAFHGKGPTYGASGEVEQITYEEALAAARTQIQKTYVSASVIGDIGNPKAQQAIETFFKQVFSTERQIVEPLQSKPLTEQTTIGLNSNSRETSIVFGSDFEHSRNDYFVATIVAHALGGSISRSRLGKRVRFEGGLAYVVETNLIQNRADAALVGYIGTSPDNAKRVIEIIGEEWAKLAEKGLSQSELSSAKGYLKDSFALVGSDSRRLAAQMEKAKRLGFGPSYFEKWKAKFESVTMIEVDTYLQNLRPRSSLKILFVGSAT